jgi:hypothetical protein
MILPQFHIDRESAAKIFPHCLLQSGYSPTCLNSRCMLSWDHPRFTIITLGKLGLYQLVQERDLKIITGNTHLCTEQTASSLIKKALALQFIASPPALGQFYFPIIWFGSIRSIHWCVECRWRHFMGREFASNYWFSVRGWFTFAMSARIIVQTTWTSVITSVWQARILTKLGAWFFSSLVPCLRCTRAIVCLKN